MKEIFSGSDDIYIRQFVIAALRCRAAIVFTESMADTEIITSHIIEKLTLAPYTDALSCENTTYNLEFLKNTLLTAASFLEETSIKQIVKKL